MSVADRLVLAWGANAPLAALEVAKVAARATEYGVAPMCLGTTKSGQPRHPLMLAYDTELVPWVMSATKD